MTELPEEENMSRFTASLAAVLGVIALTLAFTFTNAGQAIAQGMKPVLVEILNDDGSPVPVADLRRATDRVLLEMDVDSGSCINGWRAARRVLPDGTSIGSFTVPPGNIFVMTDLRGVVQEVPELPWVAGSIAGLQASMGVTFNTSLVARAVITAETAESGIIPVAVQSQSGVYGASTFPVCISAGVGIFNGGKRADARLVQIEGYLIPE